MDFLLVSATGLTAVEMLGFLMDIFHMSLSGSFVPLNLPMPRVLNKNPALVISACPEQVTLEHRALLWHVQSCTGRDTWGGARCWARFGGDNFCPSAPLSSTLWISGEKNGRWASRNMKPPCPCPPSPKPRHTHPACRTVPQKPILLTLPPASTPNPFTEMIIAVRNQFSLAKEKASS